MLENENQINTTKDWKIEFNSDIKKLFSYVIEEYKRAVAGMKNGSKIDSPNAALICNCILMHLGIFSDVFTINIGKEMHCFVVAFIQFGDTIRYFIVDPTYSKFFEKDNANQFIKIFMEQNNSRKKLASKLIDMGYFEYTEEEMKLYGDSFSFSLHNRNHKKENFVYKTKLSGEDYLNNLILKKIEIIPNFKKR